MIIKQDGRHWRVSGTVNERIYVLKAAQELHLDARKSGKKLRRVSRNTKAISRVWSSGLFTLVALSELSGISRKSLRAWLQTKDVVRPRGRLHDGHLQVLIDRLSVERNDHRPDIEEFIQKLISEGSSERLVRAILQKEKTVGAGSVRRAHRPDDKGHSSKGEASGRDHLTDSLDDEPGRSEELPESPDFGHVQKPAARNEAPEPGSAEVEGIKPLDTYVDDEGRTVTIDETGTHVVGYDWDPLEGFEFDETGDGLLLGSDDEGGDGGLPGLPAIGAPWEQAEEA